ncbi:MAG: serine hydrolase domain-containing protein [Burkholderiales bacterium]
MNDLARVASKYGFGTVHAAMRHYVDAELLPGISCAVMVGRDLVDLHCEGWADKESKVALRTDHLFRAFSNTKLVTSCAALLLVEEGRIGLDDPVERYIPQLGNRQVLRPGAQTLDDTEPADRPITIRHLLSHSSGLGYGVFDLGTVLSKAFNERMVRNPNTPLTEMIEILSGLPLAYHPGEGWQYSIATDVVGRLVEIVSGQRLDAFFQSKIFGPLGMVDTGFVVPEGSRQRLTAYYAGASLEDPMKPGLTRTDDAPYPQAYLRPFPRLSGGGGLVTSLPDMIALVRSLLSGGPTLLKRETLAQMMTNQLPQGRWLHFTGMGEITGKGFGLAGAVAVAPTSLDPRDSAGELHWGGVAGTHWWISPKNNLVGLLMTQRQMAFWHPFFFELKNLIYQAVR